MAANERLRGRKSCDPTFEKLDRELLKSSSIE
jgi:hypothetical protein